MFLFLFVKKNQKQLLLIKIQQLYLNLLLIILNNRINLLKFSLNSDWTHVASIHATVVATHAF